MKQALKRHSLSASALCCIFFTSNCGESNEPSKAGPQAATTVDNSVSDDTATAGGEAVEDSSANEDAAELTQPYEGQLQPGDYATPGYTQFENDCTFIELPPEENLYEISEQTDSSLRLGWTNQNGTQGGFDYDLDGQVFSAGGNFNDGCLDETTLIAGTILSPTQFSLETRRDYLLVDTLCIPEEHHFETCSVRFVELYDLVQ